MTGEAEVAPPPRAAPQAAAGDWDDRRANKRNATARAPTGRLVSVYGDPRPPPSASFACSNPRCGGRGGPGGGKGGGDGGAGRRSLASLQCSGCGAARYCSAACQVDDWGGTGGDDRSDGEGEEGEHGGGGGGGGKESDEAAGAAGGSGAIGEGGDDASKAGDERDSHGADASAGGKASKGASRACNRHRRRRRRRHGGHGPLCRRIASLRRRCAAEAGGLRSLRLFPDMDSAVPVDCFDPDMGVMGLFDRYDGSAADGGGSDLPARYCGTRFDLMDLLIREGTRGGRTNLLALELALGHALDVLHLATADDLGVRYYVASLCVPLGRWREAYDFVKYWLLTDDMGEDFDPDDDSSGSDDGVSHAIRAYNRAMSDDSGELPFLGLRDQDAFEPLERSLGSAASTSFLVDLILIKKTLVAELLFARARVLKRMRALESGGREEGDADKAMELQLRHEAADPVGPRCLRSLLRCLDCGHGRAAVAGGRGGAIGDLSHQCNDLLAVLRARNEAVPLVMRSVAEGRFGGDPWRIDEVPEPGTVGEAVAICRRSRHAWVGRPAAYDSLISSIPDHWVPMVDIVSPGLCKRTDYLLFMSTAPFVGPSELNLAGMYPLFVEEESESLANYLNGSGLSEAAECFQWVAWREFQQFPPVPSGPNLWVGTQGAFTVPQENSPRPLSTVEVETIYRLHSLGSLLAAADKKRYDEQMSGYSPPEGKEPKKRNKTGYNMFFSAYVAQLKQSSAGVRLERSYIARLVGHAWKELTSEEKRYFETEAEKRNQTLKLEPSPDADTKSVSRAKLRVASMVGRPDGLHRHESGDDDDDDDNDGDYGLQTVLEAFRVDAVIRAKCGSFDDYATLVDRDPDDPFWAAVVIEAGRRQTSEYLAKFPSRASVLARRVTLAQGLLRGHWARRLHRGEVVEAMGEYRRLVTLWRPVRSYLDRPSDSRADSFSWASYRQQHLDMSRTLEDMDDEGHETSRLITDATLAAAREDVNQATNEADEVAISEHEDSPNAANMSALPQATTQGDKDPMATLSSPCYDNVKLTHSVLKWFKEADQKYRDMFCRRLHQLASGERSRILKKHLTGCKHAIWETYLDQASAQRIIWTECREKGGDRTSILIWYVAKHKWVSRYINLIDKAEARLTRHVWRASSVLGDEDDETMVVDDDTVLIDPLGNVPLKLYQMPTSDVVKLTDDAWSPSLRLTTAEKEVVMTRGTVLLLGRSGTGKTVCVCNRMVYDLENRGEDLSFRQLFIARSPRICAMVKMLVEQSFGPLQESITSFVTFEDLTRKCDMTLRELGIKSTINGTMRRISFSAFKREFFAGSGRELDPLVAWTQIRSFMKGSIEAVQTGNLTKQAYMTLGTSRCRLKPDQREKAYAIFKSYEGWLQSNKYYDDCDAITDLLGRFRQTTWEQRKDEELVLDNIYVDEVQDFTQAEIAFFWGLCDGGALFLAGDTAQSVVEGVSFRFDEVRSVAAVLSGGDRQKIPKKPFILGVNFRSHSGVLNIAAAVLRRMYSAFPGSANKIDPDEGLFKGPRPAFINNLTEESFQELLEKNPTMVLLTHDSNVPRIKKLLEDDKYHHIVLGIVEAKGLDFAEVMIVDFFSGLSSAYQKPWTDLLKTGSMFKQDHFGNPELEMQLKLLYTSITRARHRLFFVETKPSQAGGKFFRWLLDMKLAEKQNVTDMEVKLKTPEEWRTEGVEWACTAELEESEELVAEFFKQAILYFKLGGDESLAKKARVYCNARLLTKEVNEGKIEFSTAMAKVQVATLECLQEGFQEKAADLCSLLLEMTDNKRTRRILEDNIFTRLNRGVPNSRVSF